MRVHVNPPQHKTPIERVPCGNLIELPNDGGFAIVGSLENSTLKALQEHLDYKAGRIGNERVGVYKCSHNQIVFLLWGTKVLNLGKVEVHTVDDTV